MQRQLPLTSAVARPWVCWLLIVVAPCVTREVVAHELGFGSAELAIDDERVRGELVLDVERSELETPLADRRDRLLRKVEGEFTLRCTGKELSLAFQIAALGSGPSAVDVLAFHGDIADDCTRLSVASGPQLGDIALNLRRAGGGVGQGLADAEGKPFLFELSAGTGPSTNAGPAASSPEARQANSGSSDAYADSEASKAMAPARAEENGDSIAWYWRVLGLLGALLVFGGWKMTRMRR